MSFGSMTAAKADYELPSPPSDGVSDLTFSPNGSLITAGSWDKGVSVLLYDSTVVVRLLSVSLSHVYLNYCRHCVSVSFSCCFRGVAIYVWQGRGCLLCFLVAVFWLPFQLRY